MPVYAFPDGYDAAPCFLVPINAALIPLVAGALRIFEERRSWANDTDYERGYNAIVELEAYMTALCVAELVQSNERIYRLLDSALNGVVYTTAGLNPVTGLMTVLPAIANVPPSERLEPGARWVQERAYKLLDNLTNGTVSDVAPDTRNIRQQLDDLIAATGGQGLDDEQLAELVKIVAALA